MSAGTPISTDPENGLHMDFGHPGSERGPAQVELDVAKDRLELRHSGHDGRIAALDIGEESAHDRARFDANQRAQGRRRVALILALFTSDDDGGSLVRVRTTDVGHEGVQVGLRLSAIRRVDAGLELLDSEFVSREALGQLYDHAVAPLAEGDLVWMCVTLHRGTRIAHRTRRGEDWG